MKKVLIKLYAFYWNYVHWRSFILNQFHSFAALIGSNAVLRLLGAKIGSNVRIHHTIVIQNAHRGSCTNLRLGNNVYIGPRCLFDLASCIEIQNDNAISADVKFVTHSDVGQRPLREVYPRKEGPIVICEGSWLGTGATILHGVKIGPLSVIGAMSLVNKDVPEHSVAYGVPAKIVRELTIPESLPDKHKIQDTVSLGAFDKLRRILSFYYVDYNGATSSFRDGVKLYRLYRKGESLTEGRFIDAYQKKLSNLYEGCDVATFAAGRMALYAILKAMKLPKDGEVIVPGYTCIVTPAAIKHAGYKPVYADVSSETFNITPEAICQAITPKTCAILAQHTFGIPCDLEALVDISKKKGIPLIEDCAHAIGASYRGRRLGLFGVAAFFSTQATKMISTSRGGFTVAMDSDIAAAIRRIQQDSPFGPEDGERNYLLQWCYYATLYARPQLNTFCRAITQIVRKGRFETFTRILNVHAEEYENSMAGKVTEPYPARLGNLMAMAGIFQLERLEDDIKHRRMLVDYLEQSLPKLGARIPQYSRQDCCPSWPRYPFLVENTQFWRKSLFLFGLAPGNWLNHPIHPQGSNYRAVDYVPGQCPVAERLSDTVINVPVDRRVSIARLKKWIRYCQRNAGITQ